MDFVVAIVGSIVDYSIVDSIGRHLSYLNRPTRNLEALREQAEKLDALKEDVLRRVDLAGRRHGEIILAEVEMWLMKVDEETSRLFELLERDNNISFCPHLSMRYRINKEATRMAFNFRQLQEDGRFDVVSYPAPPPEIMLTVEDFGSFDSAQLVLGSFMEALKDSHINVIGIYGMAGVGKTTLAKQAAGLARGDGLFDKVVMVTVSQNVNVKRIQGEIADMLGLELDSETEIGRAQTIKWRLGRRGRVLVIFDDVWETLDLSILGIPHQNESGHLKIIFISRRQSVCTSMRTQKYFLIKLLSEQDAWNLLRKLAGDCVDSPHIQPMAREVVKRCGGLPIAIITVGKALENKSRGVWIEVANDVKNFMTTKKETVFRDIFQAIGMSFNYLEQDARVCFLLCSLFPENCDIAIEDIFRYGIGLGLFEAGTTIEGGRNRAHLLVKKLEDSCLLLASDKKGYVRMHVMCRSFATSMKSGDENLFMVDAGLGLKEWPIKDAYEHCTAISLVSNDIFALPDRLEFKKLRTLLLQHNYPLLRIPDSFFEGMKQLEVLDLSDTCLLSLPLSFQLLVNLRTLYLNRCKLRDVSVLGELNKLEILCFSGSDIRILPTEIKNLARLRLLDLENCKEIITISPHVLSSLSRLEELYMGSSFVQWEVEVSNKTRSNANLEELLHLSCLNALEICVPAVQSLPISLHFENLMTFKVSIGSTGELCNDCSNSGALRPMHNMHIPSVEGIIAWSKKSGSLKLYKLKGVKNVFSLLNREGLKSLSVKKCDQVEYLNNTTEGLPRSVFPRLEALYLYGLVNLKGIYHGQLPSGSFQELKFLEVKNCASLLCILPSKLLRWLLNLEILTVANCGSLREVFDLEGTSAEVGLDALHFGLRKLQLFCLTEMMHIWKGPSHRVNLQKLCSIEVKACKKLRTLFSPALANALSQLKELRVFRCNHLEEIVGNEEDEEIAVQNKDLSRGICFQKLRVVSLSSCHSLRNLFSPSVASGLTQLELLDINWCDVMEEIVVSGKTAEGLDMIRFPKLSSLNLRFLPNLMSFCSGTYRFEFPDLKTVWVESCPKMETFTCGHLSTPELKRVQVGDDQWLWKGNLNNSIQHLFKEKDTTRFYEALLQKKIDADEET